MVTAGNHRVSVSNIVKHCIKNEDTYILSLRHKGIRESNDGLHTVSHL